MTLRRKEIRAVFMEWRALKGPSRSHHVERRASNLTFSPGRSEVGVRGRGGEVEVEEEEEEEEE